MVESSRRRAILGGDNTEQPELLYLPRDSEVAVGDRIITSGHGGMFPPGLPVGVVSSVGEHAVRVQPLEDFSRVDYVRIVDFHDSETEVTLQVAPGYAREPVTFGRGWQA